MPIVIEDGSIVSGANSYITDAEYTVYCDLRGLTYAVTASAREQAIIKGMDYIESLTFKGQRVEPDNQELEFPRAFVYAKGRAILSTEIPKELKAALCEAANAAETLNLMTNEVISNVESESVGSLSVSYFKGGKKTKAKLPRVMNAVKSLLYPVDQLVRV